MDTRKHIEEWEMTIQNLDENLTILDLAFREFAKRVKELVKKGDNIFLVVDLYQIPLCDDLG